MAIVLYAVVTFISLVVGIGSGLGPGLIMRPLFDLINIHSVTEIGYYISIAFFPMLFILTYRFFKNNKSPIDWSRVLVSACGAIVGGIVGEYLLEYLAKMDETLVKQIQTLFFIMIIIVMFFYFLDKIKIKEKVIETKNKIFWISFTLSTIIIFLGFGGRGLNLAAYMTFFPYDKKEAPLLSLVIIFFSLSTKLTKIALTTGFGSFDPKIVVVLLIASTIGSILGYAINKYLPKKYGTPISLTILVFVAIVISYNFIKLF